MFKMRIFYKRISIIQAARELEESVYSGIPVDKPKFQLNLIQILTNETTPLGLEFGYKTSKLEEIKFSFQISETPFFFLLILKIFTFFNKLHLHKKGSKEQKRDSFLCRFIFFFGILSKSCL